KKNAQIAQLDGVAAVEGRSLRFTARLQLQEFFQYLAGAIGRAVVHQHDLFAKGGIDDTAQDLVDGGLFVVDGNDDGEFGVGHGRRVATVSGHRFGREFSGGPKESKEREGRPESEELTARQGGPCAADCADNQASGAMRRWNVSRIRSARRRTPNLFSK